MTELQQLQNKIEPLRQNLLAHDVYQNIQTVKRLNRFMEHHVFAVWDFMSLLKALQQHLTCIDIPWIPKGNSITTRLINEIVLGEESDLDQEGSPISHFKLYLHAMKATGAQTDAINNFIDNLRQGHTVRRSLSSLGLNEVVSDFIQFTFDIVESNKLHCIASVFTFGREDLIPGLFSAVVKKINKDIDTDLSPFLYYLERHIELDSDKHGPMALKMMDEVCGLDPLKWEEATQVSVLALKHRIKLWDLIKKDIQQIP